MAVVERRSKARTNSDCNLVCPLLKRLESLESDVQTHTKLMAEQQIKQQLQGATLETIGANLSTISANLSQFSGDFVEFVSEMRELIDLVKTAKGMQSLVKFLTPFALGIAALGAAYVAIKTYIFHIP